MGVGPGPMGLLTDADGMGAIIGSSASAGAIQCHGRKFLGGSVVGLIMSIALISVLMPPLKGQGSAPQGAEPRETNHATMQRSPWQVDQ